ncbi:U-box domain-containing protein 3 [Phtheirospermum japonicum]|uniref:U-box domain-containing protein 3 n=1 Tax=Phtheirospermum japonicum TaxID=374723 RepID=A0A830BA01_9LAMI|nr:U-box domain-containing protein 3 [Phtheirospermum japonicum]
MGIEDSSSGGGHCHVIAGGDDVVSCAASSSSSPSSSSPIVNQTLALLQSDDPNLRLQAAREIRRLTKTSQRYRRHFSGSVEPLVEMLGFGSADANEAALAALLNLAVKDETNKINIIQSGALKPIIAFLQSENATLQEHAVAALITLSASPVNKPIISASNAIPHLVNILKSASSQAKLDAVLALYNLSTHRENIALILKTYPIPPLVNLLKSCKKSSRAAEKCTALIESLVAFDEGRTVITSVEGGILAVVEVLEGGSLQSREHAVGALLTMCQSDREKYREPILGEGVVPGLLELTVQGTAKAQSKARTLLRLLRESPYPRPEAQPDTLENIVCDIMSRIDDDGEDQTGKAKRMLSEMVQVSMEQSLRHLQERASGLYTG